MQEFFWSTLKTEFYDRRRRATRHEAIRATGRWIEEFYNRAPLHSALLRHTRGHERLLSTNKPQPAQPPDQLSRICGYPKQPRLKGGHTAGVRSS